MKFPYQKIVEYENETEEVAKEFIKVIKNGDIVLLNGELGSGKSDFLLSFEIFSFFLVNQPTIVFLFRCLLLL